jgi:hypothetical protein
LAKVRVGPDLALVCVGQQISESVQGALIERLSLAPSGHAGQDVAGQKDSAAHLVGVLISYIVGLSAGSAECTSH